MLSFHKVHIVRHSLSFYLTSEKEAYQTSLSLNSLSILLPNAFEMTRKVFSILF
jgi:hypothetical protein